MRVSVRTQLKVADFASGWSAVSPIARAYEAEGFLPNPDQADVGGQRRTVCASYHSLIDPESETQQRRLLNVYLDAIDSWGREDDGSLRKLALDVVRSLRRDGIPIDDRAELTAPLPSDGLLELSDFHLLRDPGVVQEHLERMQRNLDHDPPAVIGAAKELIESVCRLILDDCGVSMDPAASLPDLYKGVAKELRLARELVPENAKGGEAAQRVLQGLITAVQNLAEMRNALGVGHGRARRIPALERHARLAMNASRTVAEFLLATWHERRDWEHR